MTHHEIRTLPDGTRRYSNGTRYKPKPVSERKYAVRKPDDPRAVRFRGDWFLPLQVLPDRQRKMPLTRPDEETLTHKAWCRCHVCKRPAAQVLWTKQVRSG